MSDEARGSEVERLWRELLAHVEACSECIPDDLCEVGGGISQAWRRASVDRRAAEQEAV